MFRIDRIEDMEIIHGVQVQLVMRELRTESGGQDNVVDDDVDEQHIQDLALNVDNVFQADDCDAFDSNVDEAPTAQTMFMANLSSADLVYDEACPSYDSDVLSEDNTVQVVQSDVSVVPNDAYMMILNDMHEPPAQHVYVTTQTKVVDKSLTAKLATYKEQVELYERWARFELTEREQNIDEQLRIFITDRNIKEENLKKELHSIKMQLFSTINHNKLMVEEVTSLKKDFKQKANQYLEEFCRHESLKRKDVLKMKTKALKEQVKAAKPVKALMVYPPNTPVRLVSRVLPTKIQVKINIFALIQLFSEFEKTCKKRITPTGLTEGERGFEETMECYLIKVIPFFKTLKENFAGIQKALTTEIKEMKAIFDELEAEVNKNAVNRKCDEIEHQNILIVNDTLIANCLSKEVFYIATNSELNVSRFFEMHDAHTVVQAHCLELETELFKLKYNIQKEDHDVMETRSEVDHTLDFRALDFQITQLTEKVSVLQEENELFRVKNEKVKQHYKELYDSIKITHAKCNTPKLARNGILGSGRATSWINNTRYILNDQKVI
nr:hypothetical protein [Tanacetum cinerariifolium]